MKLCSSWWQPLLYHSLTRCCLHTYYGACPVLWECYGGCILMVDDWLQNERWVCSTKQYNTISITTISLSGSDESDSYNNLVKSLSSLWRWTCKNAFSISVDIENLWSLNRTMIEYKSWKCGAPTWQSSRLGETLDWWQLQSYTIPIMVVSKSFLTAWCGMQWHL